jgi:peroxiredoxin
LAPEFDFTVTQKLGLQPSGSTAELILGDMSLDTTSWIANLFNGPALDSMRPVRDKSLEDSDAKGTVRSMLDANVLLGPFLESLLKPPRRGRFQLRGFDIEYTSAEIRPSGVVLHGSLSLMSWPDAHVEFEQVPPNPRGPHNVVSVNETDYSALRSWIPGGIIQRYEWAQSGQTTPGYTDENKFILIQSGLPVAGGDVLAEGMASTGSASGTGSPEVTDVGPAIDGSLSYSTMCLTVHGSRLSASGDPVMQPVNATICGTRHFPIGGDYAVGEDDEPTVALARASSNGLVDVTGHTAARPDETGSSAPNLIVHFADNSSSSSHAMLSEALRDSKRNDAPTAILLVAPAGGLSKTRYSDGITYAEDEGERWSRRFGVTGARRPLTLVVAPDGKVVWKHEGEIDRERLAEALRKSLVARTPVRPSFAPAAKTGQYAPNFLFEYAPGREITLAKLVGRAAVLIFFRGSATPSDEDLRHAQQMATRMNGQKPIILAIGGEGSRSSTKAGREFAGGITVVPDPGRAIAHAYGVNVWPTTVVVDSSGTVQSTSLGRQTTQSAR